MCMLVFADVLDCWLDGHLFCMSRCKVLHAAWLKLYLNRIDTSHCTTRTTKARYLRALAAADDLKVLIHSRATEAEAEAGDARFRILQYSFLFQHCTMIRQVYSREPIPVHPPGLHVHPPLLTRTPPRGNLKFPLRITQLHTKFSRQFKGLHMILSNLKSFNFVFKELQYRCFSISFATYETLQTGLHPFG